MIENILTSLIGCPPDFQTHNGSKNVRTWYYESNESNAPRHKGIFGNVLACFGMVQTQQRGALKYHVLLWGGINPKLLEKNCHIESLCL